MSTLFNALKDFAFENAVPLLTSLFLLTAAFAAAVLVYPRPFRFCSKWWPWRWRAL